MKKISKMLSSSRRRAADGGDPEPEARGQRPALTEVPVQHQLPPRRAGGVVVRRASLLGANGSTAGRIVADDRYDDDDYYDDDENDKENRHARRRPCPRCAAADIPALLDWAPGQPRPWVSLAHVLVPPPSPSKPSPPASSPSPPHPRERCPFCAFFRALLLGDQHGAPRGTFTPYLRIRQAFERLEGVGERHELAGAVLGEVMTRNKALPWGYVLRAEDDGAGVAGYLAARPARMRSRAVPPLLDPAVPRCWIDFCREHHGETCGAPAAAPVRGLRLVDCETRRVVCVDDLDAGPGLEYATLSYAWGRGAPDPPPAALDSAAVLDDDLLPPLFADALAVTAALGLRYLWIDRLCTLPLAAAERRRQAELMGEILAGSALTLIVAAGSGARDRIPGVGAPREAQLSLSTRTGVYATTLLRPDAEVAASAWASRAWTFQEGLFARRRLVFTPSQLYFQCRALHCHESVALPLRLAPGVAGLGRVFPPASAPRPAQLRERVGAFMARESAGGGGADRLDAFRGVLREYARMDGLAVDHFLALPLFHPDAFVNVTVVSQTDRLAVALGWVADRGPPLDAPPEPCYALDGARDGGAFPSWTWLAWALRPGRAPAPGRTFGFDLVGEASPIFDGLCASPLMEISVGFADRSVLSWEIDGDAIARKADADAVAFLHLKAYCFDVRVRRTAGVVALDYDGAGAGGEDDHDDENGGGDDDEGVGGSPLRGRNRATVEAWLRAAPPPDDGPHVLTAVLVSGRNWKDAASPSAATALVCRRRGWDPAAPLVRLGALTLDFAAFHARRDVASTSVMRDVAAAAAEGDEGGTRDIVVRLRDIDLY